MIVPVVIVLIVVSIFSLFDKVSITRLNKQFLLIGIPILYIVLIYIVAFRPSDMPDYYNYRFFYDSFRSQRYEIGFRVLTGFLRDIHIGFYPYLACMGAISIGLKLWAIKRLQPLFWTAMVVYVTGFFILHDMIQIRAAVASGLYLCAVYFRLEKKTIPFIVCCTIGFLFHYSALLIIPVWFLSTQKTFKKIYIWLIPGAYVLYLCGIFIGQIMQMLPGNWTEVYARYIFDSSQTTYANALNGVQMLRCAICLFLWWKVDLIIKKFPSFLIGLKLFTIGLIVVPLFSNMSGCYRISEFLIIVEVFVLPGIVFLFNKKDQLIGHFLIIAYSSLVLWMACNWFVILL